MRRRTRGSEQSVRRLFAIYAVVSLVPVVVLGLALLALVRSTADTRGLADARSRADLVGRAVVAPALSPAGTASVTPLQTLSTAQAQTLDRSVRLAVGEGDVARLRVRDLSGRIVYSDDGSTDSADGADSADDAKALAAAGGRTVSTLTNLNDDAGDVGPRGPAVVEVYEPLLAPESSIRIGVLEVYVPYAPIAAAIGSEQRTVSLALAAGLALLWGCLLIVSVSVTRQLRRQAQVSHFLASHDAVTGLPNRTSFAQRIDAALAGEERFAVAVLDLDRFKEVNDVLGHDNGDVLLKVVAERLSIELGEYDLIARLGGDEFGLLLRGASGAGETSAQAVLARVRGELRRRTEIDDLPLVLEASIGLVLAPADGVTSAQLLARADLAMYVAKRQRLGVVRYDAEYEYDSTALALAAELGPAIEEDQLLLHFQPKGDVGQRRVTGYEALVRWQHPTRGLLYPDTFVPQAEQTELINRLTQWVFRRAARAIEEIDPGGRMYVAVNVSAASVTDVGFADELLGILAEEGTPAHRITVEVTETALLADPKAAATTLSRLAAAGLRISIDDFGAGQTSLGYLATLPITELKIDKSFVMPMLADPRKTAIVRSVIQLAHSLGFTVTAEGVESTLILDRLREEDCDTVQGYLLARPVPQLELPAATGSATAVLEFSAPPVRAVSWLAS